MVSDVSSVVSDYLFSGKPFAMIAVPAEPEVFVVEYPVARASYVILGQISPIWTLSWRGCSVTIHWLVNEPTSAPTTSVISADNYAAAFVDAVHNVSRKSMEDMEDDQADDAGAEQGGRDEDDNSGGAGRRCGCTAWA